MCCFYRILKAILINLVHGFLLLFLKAFKNWRVVWKSVSKSLLCTLRDSCSQESPWIWNIWYFFRFGDLDNFFNIFYNIFNLTIFSHHLINIFLFFRNKLSQSGWCKIWRWVINVYFRYEHSENKSIWIYIKPSLSSKWQKKGTNKKTESIIKCHEHHDTWFSKCLVSIEFELPSSRKCAFCAG